jgi:alpha-ketoglutarate-dependent 2,4-dichlorophenoxyacetate dioxygenase
MSLKPSAVSTKSPFCSWKYHKLVQIGPDGRKTMALASHAKRILGWPEEASSELIQYLREHCAQEKYAISVSWKQPTDIVWWDNRTVMHRATPFSDQMEVRDMRRTTVLDDGIYANGVEWAVEMESSGKLPYTYSAPAHIEV